MPNTKEEILAKTLQRFKKKITQHSPEDLVKTIDEEKDIISPILDSPVYSVALPFIQLIAQEYPKETQLALSPKMVIAYLTNEALASRLFIALVNGDDLEAEDISEQFAKLDPDPSFEHAKIIRQHPKGMRWLQINLENAKQILGVQ